MNQSYKIEKWNRKVYSNRAEDCWDVKETRWKRKKVQRIREKKNGGHQGSSDLKSWDIAKSRRKIGISRLKTIGRIIITIL